MYYINLAWDVTDVIDRQSMQGYQQELADKQWRVFNYETVFQCISIELRGGDTPADKYGQKVPAKLAGCSSLQ